MISLHLHNSNEGVISSPCFQEEIKAREGLSNSARVTSLTSGQAEDARDSGLIPGSGRSPGGGNGNPLQYSGLGNPTDRGA